MNHSSPSSGGSEMEKHGGSSEAYLESLINGAPLGIYLVDADFRLHLANPIARALFGETADLIGRDFDGIAHTLWSKECASEIVRLLRQTFQTGETYSAPQTMKRRETGATEHLDWKIARIPFPDGRHGIVCYFRDISPRVLVENAVHKSRQETERQRRLYEAILSNTPDLAYVFDLGHRFIYANDVLLKMWGKSWDEAIGKNCLELGYEPWHAAMHDREIEQVITTKQPIRGEVPFTGTFGRRIYDYIFVPIFDANGQVEAIAGTTRDVTDSHNSEQTLRRAKEEAEQASQAKDNFLAQLSHELRTPLTPVLMTASELREDPSLPESVRDQLAMIERNVALEARLIDDLLDLTRVSHGKLTVRFESCDLHSLLRLVAETVHDNAREKRLDIALELTAQRSHFNGDPARLQQVFWNILGNAVKFTPDGGRIAVRTSDHQASSNLERQFIRIEISDDGIGFAPEISESLFKAFEQGTIPSDRRGAGLGLGLAIARSIVEIHEGKITATSGGAGRGATFTVEFPATHLPPASAVRAAEGGLNASQPQPPLRLLLVEDHQPTLNVLTRLLARAGHHVKPASSVAEAKAAADAEKFDVVISDVGLPDGTGLELMQHLRARHGLQGIALSGYGMEEDLQRTRDAGFAAHLVKPVSMKEVRRVLSQFTAAKG